MSHYSYVLMQSKSAKLKSCKTYDCVPAETFITCDNISIGANWELFEIFFGKWWEKVIYQCSYT